MHVGHLYAYDHLCKKFGKDNVYIATSDKQSDISPLNFKQKRKLATKSFGIPKDSVVKYETAIKAGKFMLIAHGTADEVQKARAILQTSGAEQVNVHQQEEQTERVA